MPTVTLYLLIITRMDNQSISQLRLWQLISPSLPVGAYAYSGGLEAAVDAQWITNQEEAFDWISRLIEYGLLKLDIPIFQRLYQSSQQQHPVIFNEWNGYLLASRESSELRQEDIHMARALLRLLVDLEVPMGNLIQPEQEYAYAAIFAHACTSWQIDRLDAAQALVWSWCENQVAAAIKLVPLGQTAGQQILQRLQPRIAQLTPPALELADDDIGFSLPGLAIISGRHEQQYSRLFRS